jgi:hypothetical protein
MPYPGSKIYEHCIQKGLIKNELLFVRGLGKAKYLNITNNMSNKDIENLEKKILNFRIKYSKFAVPVSYERTSLNNYDLSVKCPYCNGYIKYMNCHTAESSLMFNFLLICRKCSKRFNIVSPLRKVIMICLSFLPLFGLYTEFLNPLKNKIVRIFNLRLRK